MKQRILFDQGCRRSDESYSAAPALSNMQKITGNGVDDESPAISDHHSMDRMREVLLGEFNGARDLSKLRFLLTRGASVNVPYKNQNLETTYAILAVLQNKHWDDDWVFQKVRLLCHFGADVNVSDADGITPLYLVIYHKGCNQPKQHILEIKVGRLLIHYGAKRAPTLACILCHTVRHKTVAHILLLLDVNVDVDEIERESGWNALMIAMDLKRWSAARILLIRGASKVLKWYDIKEERWYHLNILHMASYTGNLDQMRCLVEDEAHIAAENVWWYNQPLLMASIGGHPDAIYYLLQRMVLTNLYPWRGYK